MKENADWVYLLRIRDEIAFLEENTRYLRYERLDSDKVIQHVVQKSLEIIGEASKRLSTETKDVVHIFHGTMLLVCGIDSLTDILR